MCLSEALTKFQTEINEEFVGWEFKMEKKVSDHGSETFLVTFYNTIIDLKVELPPIIDPGNHNPSQLGKWLWKQFTMELLFKQYGVLS